MSKLALFFVVICFSAVLCTVENAVEVKIGTFEGSYSLPNKGFMNLCQDGKHVQGSWNEVGLMQGYISTEGVLHGQFWAAGSGPCVSGTFELSLVPGGIEGSYTCKKYTAHPWKGTRTSSFRPTDSQCCLISQNANSTLQGKWVNDANLNIDICYVDANSRPFTATLFRQLSNGLTGSWYVEGHYYSNNVVMTGTWYQNFNAGGAIFFLRNTGNIEYFWWTGLLGENGQTFTDFNQLNEPSQHGRDSYHPIPGWTEGATTLSTTCEFNAILKPLVLQNLAKHSDDDDNYYNFIETKYLINQYFEYIDFPTLAENSGNSLAMFTGILGIIFFLFF